MKRRFPLPKSLGGGEQELFGVHEVYYADGKVDGWTKDSMFGYFETVAELEACLKQMLSDYERSKHDILDYHAKETKKGQKNHDRNKKRNKN